MGSIGPIRAHHPLFRHYKNTSHQLLSAKFTNTTRWDVLPWTALLGTIIVPAFHTLLDRNETRSFMVDGSSTVGQIVHEKPLGQVNEATIRRINTKIPFLYYHNSGIRIGNQTEEQFLNAGTLLGHLFKIALAKCGVLPACTSLKTRLS
jgi:hypothetical protein